MKKIKMTENKKQVVIPGEAVFTGPEYLPGDGTEKRGEDIVALRYGLAEESNKLVKVIPLSGGYTPRRGNVIVGKVEILTHNGWVIDFGNANNGFLPITEVPRFVNKGQLDEVMDIGDMVVAKIWSVNGRGIDLSVKSRGLGKIDNGIIFKVNPNKVPRIIGKEGSMVKIIRDNTGCNITVGQNGYVLLEGEKIEDELFAKRAIEFVVERSFVSGLTDEVEKWFKSNGGRGSKKVDIQDEVNREVEEMENFKEDGE